MVEKVLVFPKAASEPIRPKENVIMKPKDSDVFHTPSAAMTQQDRRQYAVYQS